MDQDLASRLRLMAEGIDHTQNSANIRRGFAGIMKEAADEIERLRAAAAGAGAGAQAITITQEMVDAFRIDQAQGRSLQSSLGAALRAGADAGAQSPK